MATFVAGHWMYRAATSEARAQTAAKHTVQATLLQPTPPPVLTMAATHWGGEAWVLARWQTPGALPHTAQVLASAGLRAGSLVTVWLNAAGKVTAPPLQPAQITDRTVAAAAAAPFALAVAMVVALLLAQRSADRRRLAAWDTAWATIGPDWTRLGP
jgi:hypothetical protein